MHLVYAIIGTRPQFIKHVVIDKSVNKRFILKTIHTGQHYDTQMDKVFFEEFSLSPPEYHLHIGSTSSVSQIARMMLGIEEICTSQKPDLILVYGDTNSTLAGALVASKLNIPLAHVEAGMRSHNKAMPEEINRILTDKVSDLLFVSCEKARHHLEKEGMEENVFEVGDVMKDLFWQAKKNGSIQSVKTPQPFYYATIHRPYNTDEKSRLLYVLDHLEQLDSMVIFSCHPRTRDAIKTFQINLDTFSNIEFIEPQSYFQNLSFIHSSNGVITDSGGMQKEAYWLQKKCITIRSETEWTETLDFGANVLLFDNLELISHHLQQPASWNSSLYGNGKAGKEICEEILKYLKEKSEFVHAYS